MGSGFGGKIASAELHERDSANGTPRRPPAESAACGAETSRSTALGTDGSTRPPRQRWLCVFRLALLHRCRRRSSGETPLVLTRGLEQGGNLRQRSSSML